MNEIKLTESEQKLLCENCKEKDCNFKECFPKDKVEQILKVRLKSVNEDRIKEIIKQHTEVDMYGNVIILKGLDDEAYNYLSHALAVEFAVPVIKDLTVDSSRSIIDFLQKRINELENKPAPTCAHEPLDVETILDVIIKTQQEELFERNYFYNTAVAIHDKIKGVRI